MEAKQFAELLKNPLLVEHLPVEELRGLVQRYPFSPSLQMLMLKHHQLHEHPAYDEQLAKAAICAPDRRSLYRLVQLKPLVGAEQPVYATEEPELVTEVLEETEAIEPEAVEEEAPAPVEPEPSYSYTNWNLPIEEEPTESTIPETYETEQPVETVVPEVEALPEEVQREVLMPEPETLETAPMLEEMMGSLMEYDLSDRIIPSETIDEVLEGEEPVAEPEEATVIETEAEQEVVEEVEEHVAEAPETITEDVEAPEESLATSELVEAEEEQVVEEDEATPEPQLETSNQCHTEPFDKAQDKLSRSTQPETQKDSFIGWLKRVNRHELPLEVEQPEQQEEQSELDAMFVAGNYEASLLKDASELPLKPFVDPTAKHTKEDLMEPDEEANKRMDEQAKKSMTMGEELVTETLAKIYEIQKKTGKAIEAYEILKTRHPHKADEYDKKIQKLREI